MSSLVNDLRAQWTKGDEVLVERRAYNGQQAVHRGHIIDMHESMAVIRFVGKRGKCTELLPYKRLRRVPAASDPLEVQAEPMNDHALRAVPPAFAKIATPAQAAPKSEPKTLTSVQQTPAAAPVQTPLPDDIVAWMKMGAELVDNMRRKSEALRAESDQINAEAQRLADLADEKLAEAERIEEQLSELDKFGRVVQHALGRPA